MTRRVAIVTQAEDYVGPVLADRLAEAGHDLVLQRASVEGISADGAAPGAWAAPLVAETPLGRVGTLSELAHFAVTLLDGRSTFQTGQFFCYAGGWDIG